MESSFSHSIKYTLIVSFLLFSWALLGLPGSVFAQDASLGIIEVSEMEEQSEVSATESSVSAISFPDDYRRESLPNPEEVFGDFVVGPGIFDLELAPGEGKVVELVISNRTGREELFSLDVEDAAGSSDPTSALELLGDRVGPYSIKDYITVPYSKFYLKHGQRVRIPVTVRIPADAEPGGWYGSIIASIASDPNKLDGEDAAKPATAIVTRIGTIFMVASPGEIDREGALIDFSSTNGRSFFLSGPIDLNLAFENTGTVHLAPYGRVTITNIIGEQVGVIDMQPWFVLPQSLRSREVTWDRELLIGRYTATVQVNRSYDDIIDEMTFTFWVFPWKMMLVSFASIFIFFLLIRFIFTRFEFKRKN